MAGTCIAEEATTASSSLAPMLLFFSVSLFTASYTFFSSSLSRSYPKLFTASDTSSCVEVESRKTAPSMRESPSSFTLFCMLFNSDSISLCISVNFKEDLTPILSPFARMAEAKSSVERAPFPVILHLMPSAPAFKAKRASETPMESLSDTFIDRGSLVSFLREETKDAISSPIISPLSSETEIQVAPDSSAALMHSMRKGISALVASKASNSTSSL